MVEFERAERVTVDLRFDKYNAAVVGDEGHCWIVVKDGTKGRRRISKWFCYREGTDQLPIANSFQ